MSRAGTVRSGATTCSRVSRADRRIRSRPKDRHSIEIMPDVGRCSVASALREETLAGTAPEARRWVLIEHPGPWAKAPLDTPPLAGSLGQRLDQALTDFGAKVLLVRRTGRQEDSQTRLWRVVDTATGLSLSGLWRTERDLEVLLPALAGCAGPLSEPCPEMVLVCTHGVRDACCAIKGRPIAGAVAKALASSDVEVLECSHLNGHRFAGTALTLPDGLCYGRLDQSDAPKVMKAHAEGRVWPDRLRGQTGLVGAAQAAHVWGLRELATRTGSTDVVLSDVQVGSVAEESGGVTRVELVGLARPGEGTWVDVRREDLAPAPLSCGKSPESARGYTVLPQTARAAI